MGLLKCVFKAAVYTIFCLVAFGGAPADAQESETLPTRECQVYSRYEPARSAKASAGRVEIFQSGAEVTFEEKISGRLPVVLSISSQYTGIEETTTQGLPSYLTGVSFDAETTFPCAWFDETYVRLGLTPSFYGDDWNYRSSAFRIPVRVFAIHLPHERLTLLAGVAVYPDYENEVLPILGFIYKPSEKLTLDITPRKPQVIYQINQKTSCFLEAGGSLNSEFEVTRHRQEGVVLRYKETRLGAGVSFKPNSFIEAGISAGGVFNRTFQYRDNSGKISVKDGSYLEFRLKISM